MEWGTHLSYFIIYELLRMGFSSSVRLGNSIEFTDLTYFKTFKWVLFIIFQDQWVNRLTQNPSQDGLSDCRFQLKAFDSLTSDSRVQSPNRGPHRNSCFNHLSLNCFGRFLPQSYCWSEPRHNSSIHPSHLGNWEKFHKYLEVIQRQTVPHRTTFSHKVWKGSEIHTHNTLYIQCYMYVSLISWPSWSPYRKNL